MLTIQGVAQQQHLHLEHTVTPHPLQSAIGNTHCVCHAHPVFWNTAIMASFDIWKYSVLTPPLFILCSTERFSPLKTWPWVTLSSQLTSTCVLIDPDIYFYLQANIEHIPLSLPVLRCLARFCPGFVKLLRTEWSLIRFVIIRVITKSLCLHYMIVKLGCT